MKRADFLKALAAIGLLPGAVKISVGPTTAPQIPGTLPDALPDVEYDEPWVRGFELAIDGRKIRALSVSADAAPKMYSADFDGSGDSIYREIIEWPEPSLRVEARRADVDALLVGSLYPCVLTMPNKAGDVTIHIDAVLAEKRELGGGSMLCVLQAKGGGWA